MSGQSKLKISVITCAFRPRKDHLNAVLDALKRQTLSKEQWEFLLVDNDVSPSLRTEYPLDWHPNGQHLWQPKPGVVHARVLALEKATGDFVVLLDADNVLNVDYLEKVEKVFDEHPELGAIGGRISGEYESPPPEWAKPLLRQLAIIDLGERALHTRTPDYTAFTPTGSGMVLRRQVADYYVGVKKNQSADLKVGRGPNTLLSCDDTEIALCAFDVGLEQGYFPQLQLKHLIPSERLDPAYLKKFSFAAGYSSIHLFYHRGLIKKIPTRRECFLSRLRGSALSRKIKGSARYWKQAKIESAFRRGELAAFYELKKQT